MNLRHVMLVFVLLVCPTILRAGPPFQTDDPEPVDYGHYEFYAFGNADGAPIEMDTAAPAAEFNWGALPNLQLHIIVPATAIFPSDGPRAFGLGDIELGAKYRYLDETKHRPMIGTFTMFEIPSGNPAKGLGIGRGWARLPIWVQKSFGPWTTYGGAGETINPAPGYKNFTFGGWLLQRDFGKKWTLGGEIFSHGGEGIAAPQMRANAMIDLGGYYYFRNPGFQLLFAYGHAVAGQTEDYAYAGLYWTWGKDKDKNKKNSTAASDFQRDRRALAFRSPLAQPSGLGAF